MSASVAVACLAQGLGQFESGSDVGVTPQKGKVEFDSAAGAVYAIRDLRGAGRMETIASGRDGLGTPIAVESDSAGRIFVADQAGKVTILNGGRGPALSLSCGCAPTGLFRLSGTATFWLTDPSEGPMWVLDASGADARIVAVPPGAPPSATAAGNEGGQ